ncbi:MAG: hydroxymethylbilane synthase [Brachymonas sp.]|nr:hydroxymethylbilane synthase [Brachymonas sp.]
MPAPSPATLTIATRQSRLALWQARHIQGLLQAQGHHVELLPLSTQGDRVLDQPLAQIGGKGLFIKELELALQDGRADLAVHSLKDVPMELPEGFALACVPERADPRDAWVSARYARLQDLPEGATVGTSSVRRAALLHALRPDLHILPVRGNLDTRLRKLDEGQFDGLILAAAGLQRLGLQDRIRQWLEPDEMLPAPAQGALGIEILGTRHDVAALLQPLAHLPSTLQVTAERAVARALGGGCSVALAASAQLAASGGMRLRAAWAPQDAPLVQADMTAPCQNATQAAALGEAVAQDLLRAGADDDNARPVNRA